MKDKIAAIGVNLLNIIRRIESLKSNNVVNYEILKKLNEIQEKIFQLSDLLEEIEAYVND
ncbi:MAG: hypothetical protein B6D44_10175 [Ignavibacteriales bacterium UTCHB2]|jgi:hypothetical protein|nr:MAG: hypothetical protein B6D44_10175 [Ignavibacteriales bacterium UTCHB2]